MTHVKTHRAETMTDHGPIGNIFVNVWINMLLDFLGLLQIGTSLISLLIVYQFHGLLTMQKLWKKHELRLQEKAKVKLPYSMFKGCC